MKKWWAKRNSYECKPFLIRVGVIINHSSQTAMYKVKCDDASEKKLPPKFSNVSPLVMRTKGGGVETKSCDIFCNGEGKKSP